MVTSNFFTTGKLIAVEPFESTALEVKEKNGFATAKQKLTLAKSKVVFQNFDSRRWGLNDLSIAVVEGDIVHVHSDVLKHQGTQQVLELDGKKFVLIDEAFVRLVEREVVA